MSAYGKVPAPHMEGAIERYIEHRIYPGGFMAALLSNDLIGAFARADHINSEKMREWSEWLYNAKIPHECWGSAEKVAKWLEGGNDD